MKMPLNGRKRKPNQMIKLRKFVQQKKTVEMNANAKANEYIKTEESSNCIQDRLMTEESSRISPNTKHLSIDDSFNGEREAYEQVISKLETTLARERREHNEFLKEMSELLNEINSDSEDDDMESSNEMVNAINFCWLYWRSNVMLTADELIFSDIFGAGHGRQRTIATK